MLFKFMASDHAQILETSLTRLARLEPGCRRPVSFWG
jgi:hypothetical protein